MRMLVSLVNSIIVTPSFLVDQKNAVDQLQLVKNSAVCAMTRFKILLLLYKSLNGLAPDYLSDLVL